jgi:hypothetical protein
VDEYEEQCTTDMMIPKKKKHGQTGDVFRARTCNVFKLELYPILSLLAAGWLVVSGEHTHNH